VFELKFEIYCETTIDISFSSNVYLFVKTKLKVILFLYITFMYFKFMPQSPNQTFWICPYPYILLHTLRYILPLVSNPNIIAALDDRADHLSKFQSFLSHRLRHRIILAHNPLPIGNILQLVQCLNVQNMITGGVILIYT
jgi:hypothetical protein